MRARARWLLACAWVLFQVSGSAAWAAPPHQSPTLSFSADRTDYAPGDTALLTWTSTHTKFCMASGDWSGKFESEGSYRTPPLDGASSYTLKCNAPGGGVEQTITIAVTSPEPAPEPAPEPTPAPTLSFSASEPQVASGDSITLTWTATDADGCTASGGWSGSRPVSGSETVGPISASTTFTLSCSGAGGTVVDMLSVSIISNVTIAWIAPTENEDGTSLTDLAGYRIYYGRTSGSYDGMVEIDDPAATSHDLSLVSGSYFLVMTALDAEGRESGHSNEVSRTVP